VAVSYGFNMACRILIAVIAVLIGAAAQAQTNTALSDSDKAMIGTWELSNAERDKICTTSFSSVRSGRGLKVTFDANCGKLFPLVRKIVGWKYPQDDLLYLLDAQGEALIEFSEVEDGIFEAPTPGLGVLFLQNPAAAAAAPKARPSREVAGNWAVVRGDGAPICVLTLARDGLSVTAQPGCDPGIAKLDFTQWRMDNGDLVLVPTSGEPWRFEDIDGNWRLLSDRGEQIALVRQ
jgi:Protease inhibitor Inh